MTEGGEKVKRGRPPKKEKSVRYTISIEPMMAKKLEELCELSQLSRSEMVTVAILHLWRDCMDAAREE